MKRMSSKNGSALLIVIGMLAFMVVSAVAFSAYMRFSRQPSSYLRRSVASRQLVKAALARAIDDIDIAVCDNPHPGVGSRGVGVVRSGETQNSLQRNTWPNRVLMNTNDWSDLVRESNEQILEETVPVLTLEGLAYLPPSLANIARYYGRRTPTAKWQTFDFDSGRFAYVALDVSDYFDVNRLCAGYGRNSTPERRITITHAFDSDSNGEAWDTLMEKYRVEQDDFTYDHKTKLPLVSIADMNLAMGPKRGEVGLNFPFYDYIDLNRSQFISASDKDQVRGMTFVTDSWFPRDSGSGSGSAKYDITMTTDQDGMQSGQPFSQFKNNASYSDFSGGGITTAAGSFLRDKISTLGLIALYDYLDQDRVPVSLACPSVERVPMYCGLKPTFSGSFKLSSPEDVGGVKLGQDDGAADAKEMDEGGTTREVYQHVIYKIDGKPVDKCSVEALFMYPFLHDGQSPSVNVDGHVSFFFTDPDDIARFRLKSDAMHLGSGNSSDEAFIGMSLSGSGPSFSTVTEPKSALKAVKLNGSGQKGNGLNDPFIEIWYAWSQTKDEDTGKWSPMDRPGGAAVKQVKRCKLVTADGKMVGGDWKDPSVLDKEIRLQG